MPNYIGAYYYRGISKYFLQDYKGSIEDFSSVIRLNPDDASAYFHRAISKNELKDF